jgi:hypothetical protein
MLTTVDPGAYQLMRPVFATTYLLWATLWALVATYYGRAAYASWTRAHGRWRDVFSDVLAPFWWAVRDTLCRWKIFRGAAFCGSVVPQIYESGHILRFSIFLGSLTPITFGLQFAELDRSNWTYFNLVATFAFASTSIFAAGGHLFLAYVSRPDSWRKLVVRSIAWLLLAPPALGAAYAWHPAPLLPWGGF